MKITMIKKNRLFLLFILLMVFALYSSNNVTDNTFKSFRTKRTEEVKSSVSDLHNYNPQIADNSKQWKEFSDTQIFDDFALIKLICHIKDMEMLFFRLIIILSFYLFCLYIKRWIILVCQFKVKFFVMRYLQLKDGKKSALSLQFSF
ncbi:MAG TPA: hypothetical protein VN258_10940 [Mobilitalea sp.]|nr:hypothetical protein [Mobilitalea sp.]